MMLLLFLFLPGEPNRTDKIMTTASAWDEFPDATFSHIHILLVHSLKFCFTFIPLVGVKEGQLCRRTGALPKIMSRVLEVFA